MSGVYLSDVLAGTCGLANDDHLKYIRDRIAGHPYAGTQCKQASLAKIDAACLVGMLTDELLEMILQEFEDNYASGRCNTGSGSSTNQPQCPDGYAYDSVRSLCVEQVTAVSEGSDWFSDNWPWLALTGLGIIVLVATMRR